MSAVSFIRRLYRAGWLDGVGRLEDSCIQGKGSMVRILHLTDLHLGDPAKQALDDYKSEIVPAAERNSRISALRTTLRLLGEQLTGAGESIDALVISGDITLANQADGFEMLDEVLSELGSARPPATQTVVVPGNHDVQWRTPASSTARYENFQKHIRAKGYVSPALDGVDNPTTADLSKHVLLGTDRRWAIIPVNSANYCGSEETVKGVAPAEWDVWADAIDKAGGSKSGRALLGELRLRDVPRISPWQFDVLAKWLRLVEAEARTSATSSVKVVVLHHQLLPVSTTEEMKAFESIPNLGLLRAFLRDHGIHVVLHGHKHTAHHYRDLVAPFDHSVDQHETLVVSGGTIGMGASTNEACRLIHLDVARQGAPTLRVEGLPGLAPGLKLRRTTGKVHALWAEAPSLDRSRSEPRVVRGATVHETYERIQALFDGVGAHATLHGLICTVDNPEDEGKLPPTYPEIPGVADKEKWLSGLVDWWQRKTSKLTGAFTHGSRIFRYGATRDGGTIDQLERVVKVLRTSDATRAVITIIDPRLDNIAEGRRIPAFCSLQFVINEGPKGPSLAVVGIFRNQEMRYWWPVNVAEIARLQKDVLSLIKDSRPGGVSLGRLTTVTSIARVDGATQFFAIPDIDRAFDENESWLWDMVYAMVRPEIDTDGTLRARWEKAVQQLTPSTKVDPSRASVSLHGVGFLAETLARFKQHHKTAGLESLCDALQDLFDLNKDHQVRISGGSVSAEQHEMWRTKSMRLLSTIQANVAKRFADVGSGP